MRNYLLLASIIFASLNAQAEEEKYYAIPYDVKCMVKKSDKITYCYDLKNTPITGEMRRYDNGLIKHSYLLKNGMLDGMSKTFYRNGNIQIEKNYKKGKLNGLTSEYYENGNLKEEVSYINGKKEGVLKQYYEQGTLMSQAVYKNDKINGEYRIYDLSQRLIYNFKSTNSVLKSGIYHYKDINEQIKATEIPEVIIKAITQKCVQIHTSISEDSCAGIKSDDSCNLKWYNKNSAVIDEYFNKCEAENKKNRAI